MIQSPTCSKDLIKSSSFANSFTLPDVPSGGQKLIDNGISNPPVGKFVTVSDTTVSQTIYSSSGSKLNGLAIKPLADDQSNTPNGQDTSGTSSASGSTPSTTKKSEASHTKKSLGGMAGLMAACALLLQLSK